MPEAGLIRAVAIKEFKQSIRDKWFILFAVGFALLSFLLCWFGLTTAGRYGVAGFGRTAAGLIHLIMLIVPLMGLLLGALSITGEREHGTMDYLAAYPISMIEIVLGKFLGLGMAFLAALSIGFGVSGLAISYMAGGGHAGGFMLLFLNTVLLAVFSLGIGIFVSALSQRIAAAAGIALSCWFILVFLADLGILGSTIAFRLPVQTVFYLSLVNPIQVFKLASVFAVNGSIESLGPAGVYGQRTFEGSFTFILAAILIAQGLFAGLLATVAGQKKGAL